MRVPMNTAVVPEQAPAPRSVTSMRVRVAGCLCVAAEVLTSAWFVFGYSTRGTGMADDDEVMASIYEFVDKKQREITRS